VYRSLRPARQRLSAVVDADALLAVVPDPVVCFAGANFTQAQRYDLDAGASLVMVDWITSGRHASGERWAFSRYESRFDIRRASRRVFLDGVVLEQNLDGVVDRMRGFDVLLTAVITGPLVAAAAAGILNEITCAPVERGARTITSAARLRDGGTLLRMAGTSVEQIGRQLRTHLAFLAPLVGDDLWSRKW
jgi:urease accessory protein